MTYQEMRKLTYGWENFVDDPEKGIGGSVRVVNYDIDKLVHRELNDNKIELKHWFCEKCASRQDNDGTGFCPKHGKDSELLDIESGLYDSDYDIPIREKELIFVAMIDSPKGYRKIPYKGALSKEQAVRKQALESRGK